MTVRVRALRFAESGEAAALAAFLTRLIRWDRAAVVRVQARDRVLAVFGQPAAFQVLAVRTAQLAEAAELDITVSAGDLLEGAEEPAETFAVPRAVTGPPWVGLLPPHGGWRRTAELSYPEVQTAVSSVIKEFRGRSEALPDERRTRAELDALAAEIWSRPLGETGLPLRAVHAAQALGFLRRPTTRGGGQRVGRDVSDGGLEGAHRLLLFASGPWLRLRTPYGSVAVRRSTPFGLSVTPLR